MPLSQEHADQALMTAEALDRYQGFLAAALPDLITRRDREREVNELHGEIGDHLSDRITWIQAEIITVLAKVAELRASYKTCVEVSNG